MASVSAAKVPQSRRAGAHRAAGGFAADLPRHAGAGRGFRGGGRAYRRQKSVPGQAPRWRLTSEPGYHPHRLRYGTEIPLTRYILRGAGSPPLPDQHHPPRKSVLLGEAFGFASTGPENLRPSTRHRDLHRPIHTNINKTAKHIRGACPEIKQHNNTITKHQNNTTTQLHNDTITKPHNRKSEGHEFWVSRLHDVMSSRLQDVSQH